MRGSHVPAPLLSREARIVKNGRRGRRHSAFREQVGGAREGLGKMLMYQPLTDSMRRRVYTVHIDGSMYEP